MHQFEIKRLFTVELFNFDISFTNSSLALIIVTLVALGLGINMKFFMKKAFYPNLFASFAIAIHGFVLKIVQDNIVSKQNMRFFSFIFSIFIFILFSNLLGLMPYGFTATSHIAVNFVLAMIVFLVTLALSILKHGIFIHRAFIPHGTPWWLVPLILVLEIFSYFARPVSLAVRLAANMMAGHVMLDVMAVFVIGLKWLGIFPLFTLAVLLGFEFFVAFLQSYIFAVFACVYINQALHH
jgi:F-type H+-transporting ATPase subunit a